MGVYRNDLGSFADEASALADILNKGWDNGGDPQEGMFFYDTTTYQTKTYLNGAWTAQGNEGSPASFSLIFAGGANVPIANETITIGADVYEWNGAGANINVAIAAGDSEGCLNNLLAAAVASGSEMLLWEKVSATELRITYADAPQGNPIPGSKDIAISEASTNVSLDTGTPSNLNTQAGHSASPQRNGYTSLTIVAGMVVGSNTKRLRFGFTVVRFRAWVMSATGVLRSGLSDTFTIDNGDVLITFAAGGAADLVATDIVHCEAWSA